VLRKKLSTRQLLFIFAEKEMFLYGQIKGKREKVYNYINEVMYV